ncbi:MAG: hypothetical protein ACK55I_14205, partial [bacterium]
AGDVDTDFLQGSNGRRIEVFTWKLATRVHLDFPFGEVAHPACGHLGSPCVVHANEQHRRWRVGY